MIRKILSAALIAASFAASPATAQYAIWARDCALRPREATSDYCLNAYRRCCYTPPQPQQQIIRNGTVTIIIGR